VEVKSRGYRGDLEKIRDGPAGQWTTGATENQRLKGRKGAAGKKKREDLSMRKAFLK